MNGIIVFKSNPCNIGDYMQSLAASKFFEKTDVFIEREKVSSFQSEEPVKTIMNAWWMWGTDWPPSASVNPLFVSVHISPEASKWMLDAKGVAYLKQHEPIGCRDFSTMRMIKEKGIECYFSGCLTLTLGENCRYVDAKKLGGVIICDPYYNITAKSLFAGKCNLLRLGHTYIRKRRFFARIESSFGYKHKMFGLKSKFLKSIFRKIQLAHFYRAYSGLFTEELLESAAYTSQWIERGNLGHEQLLQKAESLLQLYAHASMVITSRIHCALPSLGCETPVLFITSEELKSHTETKVGGRLEGLESFFNLVIYDNHHLYLSPDANIKMYGKISSSFKFANKESYKDYKDALMERCRKFVQDR